MSKRQEAKELREALRARAEAVAAAVIPSVIGTAPGPVSSAAALLAPPAPPPAPVDPAPPVTFPAPSSFPGMGAARATARAPAGSSSIPRLAPGTAAYARARVPAAPVAAPPPAPPPPPEPSPWAAPRAEPPPSDAAIGNTYREQSAQREARRASQASRDAIAPERMLVHAWTWALQNYPPQALTVWLQRTTPSADPYSFYVEGDALAGEHPDRRLYEAVRAKRRQPRVAESFFGRIEGRASDGSSRQVATGVIDLPPEPDVKSTPWADPATGQPWGPAPGQAPPWGWPPPYASPYGPPPWAMGGLGQPPFASPYGPPPPWTWGPPQPAANAPPPAAIAHDPALTELWKSIQTMQAATAQASTEVQLKAAELQSALMMKLLDRAEKPAAAPSGGGSMKDAFELLTSALKLAGDIRGGSKSDDDGGGRRGIHIHQVGSDLLVEDKDGNIDPVATGVLGLKDGVKEIVKMASAARAARTGAAPSAGASSVPKKIAAAAAPAPPNGEGKPS